VYAAVPRGQTADSVVVDPYLLACNLAPDAVVAYHGALQFHGKAHSLTRRVPFLTVTRAKPFEFRGTEFVPVPVPPPLRALPDLGGGILAKPRDGAAVRVTTLERTLVDVLDAPRHGGGWEEIWRSLESVEFFDLDAVIDYAFKLESAVTVAKVGFYLEQHLEELMVDDHHLDRLRERAPRRPMYLERGKREPGKLLSRWNLVVPERILNRGWAEVT
jgi:predicted transcriptional regulator of viral defense system